MLLLHGSNISHLLSKSRHQPMRPSSCLLSSSFPLSSLSSSTLTITKHHHHHHPTMRLYASLRETEKPILRKSSNVPQSLKFDDNKNNYRKGDGGEEEEEIGGDVVLKGTIFAGLLLIGFVGVFGSVGYIYKDQINDFLTHFSSFIDGYGPVGYALFAAVYAGLELAGNASRNMGLCECRCTWTVHHSRRNKAGLTGRERSTTDPRPWSLSYSSRSSLYNSAYEGCLERHRIETLLLHKLQAKQLHYRENVI